MSTLPQFVPDDSQAITQELIAAYEAMTGKTLYPGQIERLLIDLIAYRETLVRTAINDTGRQNLVAFSRAPMLDYLGELVGVTRLPAQSARTTVRLTFADPLASALPIPSGFRVETASGIQFQTTAEVIAAAGSATIDLAVLAVEPGNAGNGYLTGQVNALVDELGVDVASVANLGVTSAGADEESDDRLRERIKLAPESFSVAGSRLAYRHHAMSAHQSIFRHITTATENYVIQLQLMLLKPLYIFLVNPRNSFNRDTAIADIGRHHDRYANLLVVRCVQLTTKGACLNCSTLGTAYCSEGG